MTTTSAAFTRPPTAARRGRRFWPGANGSTGCGLLAMSRQEPKTIYASMWDFRRQGWTFRSGNEPTSGSGLFKSTDGGDHWTEITESNAKGLAGETLGTHSDRSRSLEAASGVCQH